MVLYIENFICQNSVIRTICSFYKHHLFSVGQTVVVKMITAPATHNCVLVRQDPQILYKSYYLPRYVDQIPRSSGFNENTTQDYGNNHQLSA